MNCERSSDSGSLIGPSGLSDPSTGSVQVEHPQMNLSKSLIFSFACGSCANQMRLPLKWPIYGCGLKKRLPGLASATFLFILLPLLLLSVSQPSNGSGFGCLSEAQICGTCRTGLQAFSEASQRRIKSCVKLPLWRKRINKFEGLIP